MGSVLCRGVVLQNICHAGSRVVRGGIGHSELVRVESVELRLELGEAHVRLGHADVKGICGNKRPTALSEHHGPGFQQGELY